MLHICLVVPLAVPFALDLPSSLLDAGEALAAVLGLAAVVGLSRVPVADVPLLVGTDLDVVAVGLLVGALESGAVLLLAALGLAVVEGLLPMGVAPVVEMPLLLPAVDPDVLVFGLGQCFLLTLSASWLRFTIELWNALTRCCQV